jgi:hypothetical protein
VDKGAFTLEIDGIPMLIDRGVIRYDDPRCDLMDRSYLHNVLTPVAPDGTFAEQVRAEIPVIPQGHGDERTLEAQIDISSLWNDWMSSCSRRIVSPNLDEFTIYDHATLRRKGRVAFHLQALSAFRVEGPRALLEHRDKRIEIRFPWATDVTVTQELIDYEFRPVWRLTAFSDERESFELATTITRLA